MAISGYVFTSSKTIIVWHNLGLKGFKGIIAKAIETRGKRRAKSKVL
jgi:hypothetical protein